MKFQIYKRNNKFYFRFVAVNFPYKYPNLLSKGRAKRIIVFSWTFSACWSILGTIRWGPTVPGESVFVEICKQDNHNYHLVSFGFIVVVFVVMSVQYVDIMKVVLSQVTTTNIFCKPKGRLKLAWDIKTMVY